MVLVRKSEVGGFSTKGAYLAGVRRNLCGLSKLTFLQIYTISTYD